MPDKAESEIWLAERFAEAYNRDFGTDFAVAPSEEADSADAYLISKDKKTRVGLQICLATTEDRMREEGIQEKLQKNISATLMEKGLADCYIMLLPGRIPTKEDLRPWHDATVELVVKYFAQATPRFELKHDGFEDSPFGEHPFSSITIIRDLFRPEWKKWVIINFVVVKDVLAVDRTIQRSIDLKIAKNYSDAKSLWLLLQPGDGAHTITQVELNDSKLRGVDNFEQVWWVYPQRDKATEIYRFGQEASSN